MFSLALKNAILLILIILILHILIKNYLINFQKHTTQELPLRTFEEYSEIPESDVSNTQEEVLKHDENELYSFLFNKNEQPNLNQSQSQPQPQQGALLSSMDMDLGTISKFGDFAMV